MNFIKEPKKEKAMEILLYERKTLNGVVEMITGDCRLHTLGIVSEPDCSKCGMEEETAHHIVPCDQIYQGQIVRETTPPT